MEGRSPTRRHGHVVGPRPRTLCDRSRGEQPDGGRRRPVARPARAVRPSTAGPAVHTVDPAGWPTGVSRRIVADVTTRNQAVGAYGERCAVRHLEDSGLRVVDRNWRTARGELDIVAWEGEVLAFCEVKTRRGDAFGSPGEAVVAGKARRIRRLAAQWLAQAGERPREVRFDLVEVYLPRAGAARVEHVRGAF